MKKQEIIDLLTAEAKKPAADWNAMRLFRSSLDTLPAPLVTAFVARHVAKEAPIDLVSSLRRVNEASSPAVLAGLRKKRTPVLVFIESLLAAGWKLPECIAALKDLEPPNVFGTPAEKRALAALVGESEVLEAAQAALLASKEPLDGFLALCIAEGGESSADALIPWVERARAGKLPTVLDSLEHLAALAPKGSHASRLLELSTEAHGARTDRSAVTSLLKKLEGQGPFVSVYFDAKAEKPEQEETDAALILDAANTEWMKVYVTRGRTRSFVRNLKFEENELKLRPLESLEAFPAWLATAGKKLGVTWDWETARHGSRMRKAARERFHSWMRGEFVVQ